MPNSVPKREKRRINLGNAKKKKEMCESGRKGTTRKERVAFNPMCLLIESSRTTLSWDTRY